MVTIAIDESRRQDLVAGLQAFFLRELDDDLSDFRAQQLLDFVLGTLGPQVYNQAVQDARKFMQKRLDDLDGEVHVPDAL